MNTRGNAGRGRVGAVAGDNQFPPQSLAAGVGMRVNPAGLTDVDMQIALAQMAHAITVKAQAMTAHANIKEVQWENPPTNNMANKLRDFRG